MQTIRLTLTVLTERLVICRLDPQAAIPHWATLASFFSISRTADELSIVCPEHCVPSDVTCERGWSALKFDGSFDFALTGILVAVAVPLAEAGVSIFAVSTYDTDYVLVKESQLDLAISVLSKQGHHVQHIHNLKAPP
ncbi:MAG TPA: ACT domain-containing protein [Coleofasciculaceae cyanobacterium]|jgi:hypothetical protein